MVPSSFSQAELSSLNNADSETKHLRDHGYKIGGGRAVFSATGGKAIGAHLLGLVVPKGAVLTRVLYKVLTTFTSATDAGTIAVSVNAANDIVSAVAISNGANPWDATSVPVATIVTHTLSTNLAITADGGKELTATVAVEALTAGKMVIFAEWVFHGDVSAT